MKTAAFKNRIVLFALSLTVLMGNAACATSRAWAAPPSLFTDKMEYTIQAKEGEYEKEDLFPKQTLTDDGSYLLQDVSYYVKDQAPVLADTVYTKTITETVESEDYVPKETVTEDGITYFLSDTSTLDTVLEEGHDQIITETETFSDREAIPETVTVKKKDLLTGKEVNVICQLESVTEDNSTYAEEEIPVHYYEYGAAYYRFAGYEIPHTEDKPALQGYEEVILKEAGYDPGIWEITDIRWSGSAYEAGGVLQRDAIATGRRKGPQYVAAYTGHIYTDPVMGKTYVCTYEGTKEEEQAGQFIYTVYATATYRLQKAADQGMSTTAKVLIGVGVFILGAFLVVDLMIIANIRKEKRKENGRIRK